MYKVVNAKRMDLKMGSFLMEVEKEDSMMKRQSQDGWISVKKEARSKIL